MNDLRIHIYIYLYTIHYSCMCVYYIFIFNATIVNYYTILCYTILYYTTLYVLYYTVLYQAICCSFIFNIEIICTRICTYELTSIDNHFGYVGMPGVPSLYRCLGSSDPGTSRGSWRWWRAVTVAWAFPLPWRWRSVGPRRLAAGIPDITINGWYTPCPNGSFIKYGIYHMKRTGWVF